MTLEELEEKYNKKPIISSNEEHFVYCTECNRTTYHSFNPFECWVCAGIKHQQQSAVIPRMQGHIQLHAPVLAPGWVEERAAGGHIILRYRPNVSPADARLGGVESD